MKKEIIFSLIACLTLCLAVPGLAKPTSSVAGERLAQVDEDEEGDLFEEDVEDTQAETDRLKRAEEERKKREEEERKAAEAARRTAIKQQRAKERRLAQEKAKELDTLREAGADSTEYTIEPSSVEMVVEMDPAGYGFRQRNHRMLLGADVDLLLRGRGMLAYEYRFFNHLSVGIRGGVDYSKISLFNSFRENLGTATPLPEQFAILGGVFSKWRVTEWYMRTSVFLEPSILVGQMWQTLSSRESTHFVLRPGIFGGLETVFDSGFGLTWRAGAEFPFDFGSTDRINEVAVPLFMVGVGFAI